MTELTYPAAEQQRRQVDSRSVRSAAIRSAVAVQMAKRLEADLLGNEERLLCAVPRLERAETHLRIKMINDLRRSVGWLPIRSDGTWRWPDPSEALPPWDSPRGA